MCINYLSISRQLLYDIFDTAVPPDMEWPDEIFQDYLAPIIVGGESGRRKGLVAAYSMVPKRHIKAGQKRYSTMNARAETIGERPSYASAWRKGQLCLVPMRAFFEPSWETGAAVRWKIGMADESPFAVAGLYRQWTEEDKSINYSFTQLTVNADEHPLMKRFHRPGDEKRSLVIVDKSEYDDFLHCKDPERARAYLGLFPADHMTSCASSLVRVSKPNDSAPKQGDTYNLF